MRSFIKRAFPLTAALMLMSSPVTVYAEDKVQQQIITDSLFVTAAEGAVEWERSRLGGGSLSEAFISSDMAGSSEADWFMLAENALGFADDRSSYVKAAGLPDGSEDQLLTEPARRNVTLALLGGSGSDLSGADLEEAGCNELIWVVLSQRLCGFDDSRAMTLLEAMQHDDGGFGLRESDADVTAMALTVLEGDSADRAEKWLKENITADMTCETAAWCIIAACSRDDRAALNDDYAVAGVRPSDVLFACRTEDGGFSHTVGGEAQVLSTAQAVTALAALAEYDAGGGGLFDCVSVRTDIHSQDNIAGETEHALSQLKEIDRLNKRIRDDFYPPEEIKLTQFRELIAINSDIERVDTCYRHYLISAEELSAREDQLKRWSAIAAVFGVIWKIGAIIALWRFRKSELAKRLEEKLPPINLGRRKKTKDKEEEKA